MKTSAYNISLTFRQIFDLVRQLPSSEKIKLTKELEKYIIETKLTSLLNAFKTDDLSLDIIDREVETVRQELYGRAKKN